MDTATAEKWDRLLRQAMMNEIALAKLYLRYAELFPKQARTWTILARAEQKHAEAFLRLLQLAPPEIGPVLERAAGALEGMRAQEERLTAMRERARTGDVTPSRAVTNAAAMESSLAENLLAIFDSALEGSGLHAVAAQLLRETRHHRGMVMRLAAEAGAAAD